MTDWLLDADDVLAHVFFAVDNIEAVAITGPNSVFMGTFCYPDDCGVLVAGEGTPDLPPETAVCVEYVGPNDQYRFYSQIVGRELRGVRIELPRAVERSDRRLAMRQAVAPNRGFGFRLWESGRLFPIHDLAAGGVGVVFPKTFSPPRGELLDAEILLPEEAPMRVFAEIRHSRVRGDEIYAGTMITGMIAADRIRLARFLVAGGPRIGRTASVMPPAVCRSDPVI